MDRRAAPPSALVAVVLGLVGLAAAMGIGRFAFTPLLPLMQVEHGLTLAQGSYLASANYAGYLLGALLALGFDPRPADAARWGLAAVALSTLGMALPVGFAVWLGLRAIAGIASALVLVGVSAWALPALAHHRRTSWSGWVFAGVGIGICLAGLAVLAIAAAGGSAASGWLTLGLAAAVATVVAAPRLTTPLAPAAAAPAAASAGASDRASWWLVACYGGFGFGYIIPATFLPASARALVSDPTVFGWTWPIFGFAAAVSTILAATMFRNLGPRRIWALAQLVMAVGVVLPALQTGLVAILVSAFAVGGTFMVITMAGLQEARRVGGAGAPRLMAAMTAAFAGGQLLGPLIVADSDSAVALQQPSLIAAALLLIAALTLLFDSRIAESDHNKPSS